jgi:hypothetical protein
VVPVIFFSPCACAAAVALTNTPFGIETGFEA